MVRTQILMIEDDCEDVALVEGYLAQEPQFITALEHCQTLHCGLERLNHSAPIDVILLDLGLSDCQGVHTFEQVHNSFPEIPLIVLSGNTDKTVAEQTMQAGALDYLVKGQFDRHLLGYSIRSAIERQQQRQDCKALPLPVTVNQTANIDGLVWLYSRLQFEEAFATEWEQHCQTRHPLSLLLANVDSLSAYNAIYGHLAGDRCLLQIAQLISKIVNLPADLITRYGTENFLTVLPYTTAEEATDIAERIRTEVKHLKIPHANSSVSGQVTLSIGVVTQVPALGAAPSQLLAMADRALCQAKAQGPDRIHSIDSLA